VRRGDHATRRANLVVPANAPAIPVQRHSPSAVAHPEDTMAEAKYGDEFITHEFDEAISIQRTIVEAEEKLSEVHPEAAAKRAIKRGLKQDQRFLKQLEKLGGKHGATGKTEEVAGGLQQLMKKTLESADEAESETYEAHAVLLNLKRKQQDSASAMLKLGRTMRDTEIRDAAQAFEKGTRESAKELAVLLAELAVRIATEEPPRESRSNGRSGGRGSRDGGSTGMQSGGSTEMPSGGMDTPEEMPAGV
jgi:hypothetical protein